MPKFLLIGGFASSLINFRGPFLKRMATDFEVFAAAPFIDRTTQREIEKTGAICISNTFERTGLNPVKDLRAYFKFKKQIAQVQPDSVLAYTIKPVIFGLKAAKRKGVKRYALITGRGSGFDSSNLKSRLVKTIVKFLYRNTLKSVDGVIFQNKDDQKFFYNLGILKEDVKSTVIEGTGVDLNHYQLTRPQSTGKSIKFLFIARLIKEKGIPELFEAAELLKKKYNNFEVQLLGWIDPNPGGMSQREIAEMVMPGVFTYLGSTEDIRPFMEDADVFVLPSYYNEGLPRTIQEAMAMKKPVITTDHPGCRETVLEGVNGFLVPIKNSEKLAEKMSYFIDNPEQIVIMGEKSYEMAQEKFDVNKINERFISFMSLKNV